MPLIYQKWITRQDIRNNRDKFYVFGDNMARVGYGGQAKEMRGEPNAIGVATKWKPDNLPRSFFSDGPRCQAIVSLDLEAVQDQLDAGKTVIVPLDGIGTGLSRLPEVAPHLDQFIKKWFAERASAEAPHPITGKHGTDGAA